MRKDRHIAFCCDFFNDEFIALDIYIHQKINEQLSEELIINPRQRLYNEEWLELIDIHMDSINEDSHEHKMECYKAWVERGMGTTWLQH